MPASILDQVDILTPNENEACLLLGEAPHRFSAEEASTFAHLLQQLGPGSVIRTLVDHDVGVCEGDSNTYPLPAVPVPVIDTTAAGDIFNGALAVALCLNQQLPDVVAFANQAATLSATKRGAQTSIPLRTELEQFILAQ